MVTLYEQFEKTYPNSGYSQFLLPLIDDIRLYLTRAKEDFSSDIHFVENPQEITTLKQLLSQFKGQKIYLDVWASWCGPCKWEFKNLNQLEEILECKGYNSLYISIDRDETKWKEMIKYYNMKGTHIMANEKLTADLGRLFQREDGAIIVPWYMIVNEIGKITKINASRPSEMEELKRELE